MNYSKTAAFTLVETSLSIFLGILAMSGLIIAYIAIKTNNYRQQLVSDLLDSGRFVENLLGQRIATAGFIGCQNPEMIDQAQAIIGYSSGHLPMEWQNQVVPGTDMLVVKSCVSQTYLSQAAKITTMAYFIGDTNRVNRLGMPILGLFEKADGAGRLELAAGVEQMQIRYGVGNISKKTLHYYQAMEVNDWSRVVGVQIDLLVNSIESALKHPHSYHFHGQTIIPADLLIHNPWSIYVHLRER